MYVKIMSVPSFSKEGTFQRFGYELPARCDAKVVLFCTDCAQENAMLASVAVHKYSVDSYYCRSCGCKRREIPSYKDRLEMVPGFSADRTLQTFGYSYPPRSKHKVIVVCTNSECSHVYEMIVSEVCRKEKIVCKSCTARNNLDPEAAVTALRAYWKDEGNRERASVIAKQDAPRRSARLKALNADPAWQKKRRAGFTEDSFEKQSAAAKNSWDKNREKRLEAERLSRSQRLESLRKTVSTPEHRGMLSKNQIKQWENPEYRAKQMARWTPEERQRFSDLMKSPEMLPRLLFNKTISSEEDLIAFFFKSIDLEAIPQYIDGYYVFDFKIPSKDLYLEFNGHKWHNPLYIEGRALDNLRTDASKATWVKNQRPNSSFMTLTEDDVYSKGRLCEIFKEDMKSVDFDFKDLEIRSENVSEKEAVMFLHLFHYKERSKAAPGLKIGAYIGGKLIALAVYTYATRKESALSMGYKYKEIMELSRFCIHPSYQKKNFASWHLAKSRTALKNVHPEVRGIITFADTTMDHDGTIYKASGFEFVHETAPDYHYQHREHGGFMHKRTLWGLASKLRTTETDYAKNHGWVRVFGAKKIKFIYTY